MKDGNGRWYFSWSATQPWWDKNPSAFMLPYTSNPVSSGVCEKYQKNPKQTRNQNNSSTLYPIKDSSYRATGEFQEPCLVARSKQLLVIFQKGHSWKSELSFKKILKLFQLLKLFRVLQNRNHQDRTLLTWCHLFIPQCIFLTVLQNS